MRQNEKREACIRSLLKQVTPLRPDEKGNWCDTVPIDISLLECGLDSMDTITLIMLLEETIGLELSSEDYVFSRIDTIRKLMRLLEKYGVAAEDDKRRETRI